ncbi:LPD38 domain-containing protein, partial [Rodentibacter pneumotropicus]|uniref:MuF-C-terminal domain-containing protein n=1 Tax=Rodentibacter pneumotropicus TaxID=758 RepID=UPI0026744DCD
GKLGLGAVNIAGAAGRSRNNVEEAYDKTFKENPEQLLKLPEIQERMVQGMTFEQAVNDAKLDISDNWKTILAGAAIGATEMFTPLGKIGQGINRGVLKTLGKEVGQEALQEGAEQLNSNLAAGEIDGKTKAFDDVIRNATLGAIGGLGTGIPTAIEAGLNRNNLTEQQSSDKTIDDLANSTSSESQPTQPKSPVNGNVLEKILADHQLDQASRDELYRELKSDIEDGRLQQRLNESDREYADLARAYLEQTGQMPPADFTADSQGNVQNNGVQAEQSAVENEQVFADAELQAIEPEQETTQPVFDEDRLEQYRQASQDIVSAYQRGDITEGEVNSRYADIIQRYPEHQQLAQELYRRQQEDQEQQVLYSRSPMKSVEANIKRGQERMTQAILDKADVKRGMYNGEFGWVDFVWGDDGKTKLLNERGEPRGRGIAHIFEARERKDKVDYQSTAKMLVNNIVETIAKGSIATQTPKRLVLDYKGQNEPNGHRVILTKQKGSNAWILSGYEKFPVGGNSQLHDKTIPTQTLPTRSRQDLGATGADNVQQSTQQRNDQIQQDQQTLSRLLGEETASHIQVVDRNTEIPSGKDVKKLVSDGVEGWFEISTQKLYLISDNITADETLSRDERLAWVAWHELAHSGVRVKYGDVLTRILAGASENTVVKVIARKIQQDRGDISYPVAVEEALVEIYAAYETGNWAALENRYKTKIHESYKQGKNSVADHLTQIANYIRKLMNLIFRNPKFTEKMTTSDVFNTLSGIKEGINTLTDSQQEQTAQGDVRYSLNENADSDFAKAVNDVANGNAVNRYVQVGTTPNVLKMLGLPDVRVTISGQVLHKVMQGKHNVTAETLKQLPKQINNPVAVMRSATQDNSYVVLTELVEDDNGKDKPVIAALHLKKSSQGLELISIASVYGRSYSQIQRGLDNDLLYWNKTKGSQFLTAFGLQLPSHMQSNTNLSTDNIKTETDLSQYQSDNADGKVSDSGLSKQAYQQAKEEGKTELTFKQWKQVRSPEFKRWFGDWENDPANSSKVINPKTGEPLVVYHGSKNKFFIFDKDRQRVGWLAKGFYFSPNKERTKYYGRSVKATFLNARNPFLTKGKDNTYSEVKARYSPDEPLASDFTDILVENGHDGVFIDHWDMGEIYTVFEPNQIKSATDNNGDFSSENDDIRYSIKQSVDNLAKTGKAEREVKQLSKLRTFNGFKSLVKEAGGWLDERIADGLRPVNDWIDTFKESGIAEHEAERLKDDMYRAKGVRDALNTEIEQEYLNPIIKKVAEIAKAHKLDELSAKRLAGYWISGRYAIEKNNSLLKQEHQAMLDAEKVLNEANANGSEEEIALANREYRKAERQYRYRKHDVELALDSNEDFKVGTAGGWSNEEAANFMQNIEKHIPRKYLEALAELVYDLNQKRLDIDHQAGRYTQEQYNEFKTNRHYVPLTGDPNADENFDSISGAGSNALNVSKDRSLKGRKLSEAEDGIDASWRAVGNTTTYAGWADFKNRIDEIFETRVSELVDKGYSQRAAREEVAETLGISKSKMQGMTRSSDDVLIRKIGGEYFEYRLPQNVMKALKNDNVENANAFLKVLSKPTSWYARGVTQWTLTFAPMNMMRDTWEKSEFIRVQKLYDKNGKLLDDKTMDKIGRAVLKNAFLDKSVWAATKRLGFHQELRNSGSEALLKQLLKDGGVSTYSTYLAKTEIDLINKLKAENNPLTKKLEQAGAVLEGYNKIFDNVSALAAYKALIDHGVDPKQAAAKTLELTNFRKTGSKMRGIKALYMFSQPTAMGARNLIKYLSTEKGQKRFFGYMAVMMPLYAVLRAMDEDDEGGNVMDQLGDITRYIPIPIGGGKYLKIPVGFGMPQMAWNFSVNIVKAGMSDLSVTEAGTNMFVHSLKTFAPVSPSEISAAKYPLEKLTLTATPTILQPLMQNVLNRSAFGNKITTNFVRDDKLKAEQSKSTTAQFWKDLAIGLNDTLGIDMHPEQIKNLFDGYGSAFGSLKELQTIFVENPNREQLGRRTRTPFLNQFIGTTNEFAIQSRYYEASEEAQTFAKGYESRKERGATETLSPKERQMLTWHQLNQKRMGELRSEKGKLTRALRKGTMSSNVYEAKLKLYNQQMDKEQRYLLKRWREIQGLNTH